MILLAEGLAEFVNLQHFVQVVYIHSSSILENHFRCAHSRDKPGSMKSDFSSPLTLLHAGVSVWRDGGSLGERVKGQRGRAL